MSTRTITVFSTKGKAKAKIQTNATTWGDLKPLVEGQGYDLETLHATENINRHDLSHRDATLPEGEFTLFLRPKKTKSGLEVEGLGFKALRALVSERKHNAPFMRHMNKGGRNYTNLSTADLAKRLAAWKEDSDVGINEDVAEVPMKSGKSTVVGVSEKGVFQQLAKANKALSKINGKTESEGARSLISDISGLIDKLAGELQHEAEAKKREAKKQDEQEALEREAVDFLEGFDD